MLTQPNHAPLKLGIDFTGGTILQYSIDKKISTDDISNMRNKLVQIGIKNPVIQSTTQMSDDNNSDVKNLVSIRTSFLGDKESKNKAGEITDTLKIGRAHV